MITSIGVVVPVADEEELLPGCLRGLCTARDELRARVPAVRVRIVVVLDGCTDASGQIASSFDGVEILHIDARRVGSARRTGCAHLIATEPNAKQLWLASTDADSLAPRDWLIGMHARAADGADVVIGTVRPMPNIAEHVRAAWFRAHVLDDGHRHVHGANLGLRGDVYLRLGGWSESITGEDEDLVIAAEGVPDLRIIRTAAFPVTTSTRLVARAPFGFSSYLRGLAAQLDAEGA